MLSIKVYKKESELEFAERGNYLLFLTENFFKDLVVEKKEFFKKCKITGVMSPYLIVNTELVEEGAIVISLGDDVRSVVVSMKEPILKLIEEIKDYQTILLFVDGLSPYIEEFVKQLEGVIGNSKIMGTGVGSKDFTPKPCIFDCAGVYQDSALLVGLNIELDVGVRHGWKPIYGPLVVTKSEKNVVYEINGEPAFQVYQRIIKEKDGIELNSSNFQEIARAYPLGMISFKDDEFIIRDPIAIGEKDSLIIVSSIPVFSTIFIMRGEPEELADSVCKVSHEVFQSSQGKLGILFDCVSRVLFLGEEGFKREISKVFECAKKSDINIYGLTSIGEISNVGYDEIRVFNKTVLLGVLRDEKV